MALNAAKYSSRTDTNVKTWQWDTSHIGTVGPSYTQNEALLLNQQNNAGDIIASNPSEKMTKLR